MIMKLAKTQNFTKKYLKLPKNIQRKTDKQLIFLSQNLHHPSVRAKKIAGFNDVWEGRVDRFYRFVFIIEKDTIILTRIGPHDEALGKK